MPIGSKVNMPNTYLNKEPLHLRAGFNPDEKMPSQNSNTAPSPPSNGY